MSTVSRVTKAREREETGRREGNISKFETRN